VSAVSRSPPSPITTTTCSATSSDSSRSSEPVIQRHQVQPNTRHGDAFVRIQERQSPILGQRHRPGISPDLLSRLFTPFDRLDAEMTGIEGTVSDWRSPRASSSDWRRPRRREQGRQGSTFWIELPAASAWRRAPPRVSQTWPSRPRATPRRRTCSTSKMTSPTCNWSNGSCCSDRTST